MWQAHTLYNLLPEVDAIVYSDINEWLNKLECYVFNL